MLWVYGNLTHFNSFSAGASLYVRRRQILMYKDGPRTKKVYKNTPLRVFDRKVK